MRNDFLGALTIAVILLTTTPAAAQDVTLVKPAARQGYYLSLSSGGVINHSSSSEDEFDTLTGLSFSLRAGEMITEWIGAGLRAGGGTLSGGQWGGGFGGLQLEIQTAPLRALAITVGVGAGGLSLSSADPDDDDLRGTGGAYYTAGLSYDLFPFYESGSGGLSLTPFVRVAYLPGDVFQGTLMVAGLEVIWWSGLAKNKLDLPLDDAFTPEP